MHEVQHRIDKQQTVSSTEQLKRWEGTVEEVWTKYMPNLRGTENTGNQPSLYDAAKNYLQSDEDESGEEDDLIDEVEGKMEGFETVEGGEGGNGEGGGGGGSGYMEENEREDGEVGISAAEGSDERSHAGESGDETWVVIGEEGTGEGSGMKASDVGQEDDSVSSSVPTQDPTKTGNKYAVPSVMNATIFGGTWGDVEHYHLCHLHI